MRVTTLPADRLELLSSQAPALPRWFARGESRPEWCFLAWDKGRLAGSLGFRGTIATPMLLEVFGLHGDARALAALLAHALPEMRAGGASVVLAHAASPAQAARLESAGFEHFADQRCWRWESPWPPLEVPRGECFRSMEAIGEEAFLEALTRLLDSTQDPLLQLRSRLLGARRAAEDTLDEMKSRNAHAHWWQVFLDPEGKSAGLVCPYLDAPRIGTFGLLETIPGRSFDGLRRALLASGTAVLQSRGVGEIHYCAPWSWDRVFERTGEFRPTGRRVVLRLTLQND